MIYRLLDDILGDAIDRMDDDTVLWIASDHGFSGVTKVFHINNFLNQIGLLHVRSGKTPASPGERSLLGTITPGLLRFSKRINLKRFLPESAVNYIKGFLPVKQVLEQNVDWNKTKVFAMAPYGCMSVNLKGREPNGIVEEKDVPGLFARLKKELLAIKDADTGKGVVKDVFRSEQLYPSSVCEGVPDFLIDINEGYSINITLGQSVIGTKNMFESRKISGDHNVNGMFAAYGSIINRERFDAKIYDITPTILYLMGSAIPEDTDGRVLTEAITDEFVKRNQIRLEEAGYLKQPSKKALSEEEQATIAKQLKNLGYID